VSKPRSIRFPDRLVARIEATEGGSFHSKVLDLVEQGLDSMVVTSVDVARHDAGTSVSLRYEPVSKKKPSAVRVADRESFRPDFGSKLSK
jgi:hypothetical protein